LGLQTYFTCGEKEVRAWTVPIGSSAPKAAGVIHSDFERGFIKAEVFHYDDIIKNKSEKTLTEMGLIRQEGKNYVVKDGDCIFFKFNV
jgi:ribosome-binding ATPase YchF (GTP1/OBG family)